MKVLLDTNILLSAALFPNGVAAQAYQKAVSSPYKAVVCDWNMEELHRVFQRKFLTRMDALYRFLATSATAIEIIATPTDAVSDEERIRDVKDRPILRAAQTAMVDLLVTGDKDFLESGVERPQICSPAQFLELE